MINPLYPAFFRLDRLQLLIVGAGQVGEEKLRFILKSSPNARVVLIAPEMGGKLRKLLEGYQRTMTAQHIDRAGAQVHKPLDGQANATYVDLDDLIRTSPDGLIDATALRGQEFVFDDTLFASEEDLGGLYFTPAGGYVLYLSREFRPEDAALGDLVVAATDIREVNQAVYDAAKADRRLCNIADTPELCDFYLGSIVTRGPLKVAISTNGQSPTFAKRFRQWLEAELPEADTTGLIENLKVFRDRLTGDFQSKVRELNTITGGLLASSGAGKRCPPGGCALAAAGRLPEDIAPASAPEVDKE